MNPEENRIKKNESAGLYGLPCHVIRDLLPLYADGALSSETREMIKAHIDGCPECIIYKGKGGNYTAGMCSRWIRIHKKQGKYQRR